MNPMTEKTLPALAELARYSLQVQHPLTRQWLDDAQRLELLHQEHAFDRQLATDLDIARQRAQHFDVRPPAEAFLNRWVQASDDLEVMLSMRYQGLDVNKPFVDVSITTRPVTEMDLPALLDAALEVYGMFRPLKLRFWSPEPLGHFAGTRPDMRLIAAPTAELRQRQTPPELTLTPTLDLRHYPQAQEAYAAQAARHPNHPEQARLQSREDMQEAVDAGSMFDVLLNGVWSGYVGTLLEIKAGLPVHLVQEMLLTPEARGRGYGPYLSTLLAQHLPGDGRVLLGDIHGENLGAQRAAKAAGRHDIGGWSWVWIPMP